MKKRRERSAGVVIFRPGNKRVLLVYKKHTLTWEFPQGGVEKGESLIEAARREVLEETGIRRLRLDRKFSTKMRYVYERAGWRNNKTVTLFLGWSRERVRLSEEHLRHRWCTPDQAETLFQYENHKRVLSEALTCVRKQPLVRRNKN
ncbi:MAG: NUDIX domain-containing protein [bacterium]|nr:NUDIX domain-containing protein [bacterium]